MHRRQISRHHHHDRARGADHHPVVQHTAPKPAVNPLIVTRKTAAAMLSVSTATLQRWEKDQILTPLKISRAQNGVVFYRVADLEALISGGDHAAE
jgi:hypothetical protein